MLMEDAEFITENHVRYACNISNKKNTRLLHSYRDTLEHAGFIFK